MCRKLIFLISFVAVLGMVSLASPATITWTNDVGDADWCDKDNWDPSDDVPGSSDKVVINWSSPERGPIIGIGCNADVDGIQGPEPNFGMTQVMDINTAGTVEVRTWTWGYDLEEAAIGTGIININGSPTITINGRWRGTDNGISIVNIDDDPCIIVNGDYRGADMSGWFYTYMSGGYLEIGGEYDIGDNGGGELNMSGGTINITGEEPDGDNPGDLNMGGLRGVAPVGINMTGGLIMVAKYFRLPGSALRAGNVWLNLHDGVIDCNQFIHGGSDDENPTYTDDWRVDIEQGVLIIGGNVVDIIDGNVAEGQITAYDGEGTVVVVYDDVNDKTVVSGLPPDPNTATDPNPGNRSTWVDPNVVLSWTAGVSATDHLVFFGTSWDDVNAMTDPCATKLLGDETYEPNGPGPLLRDTTYYWRIDANNAATTWRGRIWHFATESRIVDPNMLVYYKFDEPNGTYVVTDYSGRQYHGALDGDPNLWDPNNGHRDGSRIFGYVNEEETVVDVPPAMTSTIDCGITISVWLKDAYNHNDDEDNWVCQTGAGGQGAPYHLGVMVGAEYKDAYFRAGDDSCDVVIWNLDGRDARDIEGWHHWAFVKDENADTMGMYFDGELVASKAGTQDTLVNIKNKQFKIGAATWSDNYAFAGAVDEFKVFDYGMSTKEVQTLFREEGLGFAWKPHPFDGEKEVSYDVVLEWMPGDYADSHEVYFGTSWDDINDVNSSNYASYPSVEYSHRDACSYDPCGLLDLGQTYYWRLDEVNDVCDPNGWRGRIWKFTVAEYITIDDFEKYDVGYADGQDGSWESTYETGSAIEFGDSGWGPVRGGKMSMIYWYDNTWDWGPGYYSEASTEALSPTDWNDFDIKLLTLWFYGAPDNDATYLEQMYVGVKDSNGCYAELRYGDNGSEDMNDIKIEAWQRWDIPLTYFSDSNFAAVPNDVNLADVEKLYIGFGIKGGAEEGGEGTVYFDDIQLYPPTCRPSKRPAEFAELDMNDDCIIDFGDVERMADEWLETDVNLGQVEEPCDANLLGWWKLDDGDGNVAADSSTYGHNGVIQFIDVNVSWVAGRPLPNGTPDGNALEFDSGRVRVPDTNELRPLDQVSACAWIYYSEEQNSARVVVKGADNKETYDLEVGDEDKLVFLVRDGNDYDAEDDEYEKYAAESNDATLDRDEWIHVAGTYDGNTVKCYINGEVADVNNDANAIVFLCQDTNDLAIGNKPDDDNREFVGTIDDVRIYNYGLSAEEVAYIATDGAKIFTVQSVANLYNDEDLGERAVNLRDYAELANDWLRKEFWP